MSDTELTPPASSNGHVTPAPSTELARRAPAEREVLMPLDSAQVVAGMREYQQLLRDLLEPSDWQSEDRHGRPLERPFLKKSGWRKIARAFNLSFERLSSLVERTEDGSPVRAEVWIRAVAPNGQYGDGDGYCSIEEGRFQTTGGRAKLENDLRATATTRAKNRAISDLVGMGEVSAEEIEAAGEPPLRFGPASDGELATRCARALLFLLGAEHDRAEQVWQEIREAAGGYLPACAAEAIVRTARAIRTQQHQAAA
jgi:hypothetical protein